MKIAAIARTTALVSFCVLAAGGAHAVYRCGNVYQDRPCDGGGPQPHLTPGHAPARSLSTPPAPGPAMPAPSPFAAVCSRIGQAAQQMVWKREGGATQQSQMAELPATGSRDEMIRTLDSVYRKRGSAPAIRALIEAECIAQKQQAADTAAAIKALQAQQPGANAAPSPVPAAAPAAVDAAAGKKTAGETGPGAACAGWRTEMNAINDEFRKGGNAATMERLQTRRREVDKQMLDGRC